MRHIGPDFTRVRIGIGHPGDKRFVNNHVLGDFAKADADWLDPLLAGLAEGAPALAAGDAPAFLNAIARRLAPPKPPPRAARGRAAAARGRGPRPAPAPGRPLPVTVHGAFEAQARSAPRMGSPFTARLCNLVAERLRPGLPVATACSAGPAIPRTAPTRCRCAWRARCTGWWSRAATRASPPSIRRTTSSGRRRSGRRSTAAFAAHAPISSAASTDRRRPTRPSAAPRSAPGFLTVAALTGLPLATSELGASAGLNQVWDRFAYRFGDAAWGDPASPVASPRTGAARLPRCRRLTVAERAGCDRAPPDLGRETDRLRLLSFVWADQTERKARMAAAIGLARAAGVPIETADAADWIEARLARPRPRRAHVVYHSIVWQYLGPDAQARIRASLDAAGARADTQAPLAWLRMEGDGTAPSAAILLSLWPGGETRELGRADFHGAWVRWSGWD